MVYNKTNELINIQAKVFCPKTATMERTKCVQRNLGFI